MRQFLGSAMNVLVLNAGSSSLKFQLMNTKTREIFTKGNCEKIGLEEGIFGHSEGGEKVKETVVLPDHGTAVRMVIDLINEHGFEMDAIGHRIVQGGWHFTDSALVDDDVLAKIYEVAPLAPLHNYAEAGVIEFCREAYPSIPNVAVFDTSFHMGMPEMSYTYPLPKEVREKYHVRKYGAHGTSHRYAAQQAANLLGRPLRDLGLITCHLGNGGSITAVNHGKSIDTTMGFTPLEGLMMGTRSGSIDPAILTYIMRREGISFDEMDAVLNRESGVLGVSGLSADMRDVLAAADAGNEQARLAIDMYVYRVQKAIGGFYAAMTRTDAVVMTAGIGENSAELRELIFDGLAHMGMILDRERNHVVGQIGVNRIISIDDSPIKICVVTTDEEMRIARETDNLVSQLG